MFTCSLSTGLVDRKEIVIASHKRKSLHHAFWMEQVQKVREIQTTLERNYNESKAIFLFFVVADSGEFAGYINRIF